MAAGSEHAGKVQGLDGLGLDLPEHGVAHGLELTVQRVPQLKDERETSAVVKNNAIQVHGRGERRYLVPVSWSESGCNCEYGSGFWV